MRRVATLTAASLLLVTVAACSTSTSTSTSTSSGSSSSSSTSGMSSSSPMTGQSSMSSSTPMASMSHAAGAIPTGMKPATDAKYPVGSAIVIHATHMPGMNGAKGTVAGVYDTTTYAVDYTPTTGGAMVKDHKWVVAEEIEGRPTKPLAKGIQVTLESSHMPGMKGARATIVQVVTEPVYAVNYRPTTGGAEVMDHMWVTQSELAKG